MELFAGARTLKDRRPIGRLKAAFDRADGVVMPSETVLVEAGHTLRLLAEREGYPGPVVAASCRTS
jgi:hypothetical protein